jgi:hypothetical protein
MLVAVGTSGLKYKHFVGDNKGREEILPLFSVSGKQDG